MSEISTKFLVIVNPKAAGGAVERNLFEIERLSEKFFPDRQMVITSGPGHARKIAQKAVMARVRIVICVGGDGTLNEVVNGLMSVKADRKRRPKVGYIPFGTGCDLARTMGISRNLENGLRNIADKDGRWIDLGKATFIDNQGNTTSRYFHNLLSFALGGEVAARTNQGSKALGGFLSFFLATLVSLFSFQRPMVRMKIDEGEVIRTVCLYVAIANGKYHGGGMLVAPEAAVDDGQLRITVVGNLRWWEVLLNFPKLYNGQILSVDKVLSFKGRMVKAKSDERVLVDLDGEQLGMLPLNVELIPKTLWVIS